MWGGVHAGCGECCLLAPPAPLTACAPLLLQALAELGRNDASATTLRLRLLLAELSHNAQWTLRVQDAALDACTLSARAAAAAAPGISSGGAASGGTGAARSADADAVAELAANAAAAAAVAGLGIPLGTPRMPASDRITAEVLRHGKQLCDAVSEEGVDDDEGAAGAAKA